MRPNPVDGYDSAAVARLDALEAEREADWLDQIEAEAQIAHARLATLPPEMQAATAELRAIARAHLAHVAGVPAPTIRPLPPADAGVTLDPVAWDRDPYSGRPEPLPLARLFCRERMTAVPVVRQTQEQANRRADESLRDLTGRA